MTRDQRLMIQEGIDILDSGDCTCLSSQAESNMGKCLACQAISLLYQTLEIGRQEVTA